VTNPAPICACITKYRLLQEFARAVSEVNRIHSAQLAALLNDDGFLFQEELHEALELKENVKYALLAHEQEHGC